MIKLNKNHFFAFPVPLLGALSKIVSWIDNGGVEGKISLYSLWVLLKLFAKGSLNYFNSPIFLDGKEAEELGVKYLEELSEVEVNFTYQRINSLDYGIGVSEVAIQQEVFGEPLINLEIVNKDQLSVTLNCLDGCLSKQNYFVKISQNIFNLQDSLTNLETILLLWLYWYYRIHHRKFYHMEIHIGTNPFLNMPYFNGLLINNPDCRYQLELVFPKFKRFNLLKETLFGIEEIRFKLHPQYFYSLDYLKRRK